MKCAKCDTKIPEQSSICPKCNSVAVSSRKDELVSPNVDHRLSEPERHLSPISFRNNLKKIILIFASVFIAVWLIVFFGRSFVDGIFDRIESNRSVHEDNSFVSTGINTQAKPTVEFIYKNEQGELKKVVANKESLTAFARENIDLLEESRLKVNSIAVSTVSTNNKDIIYAMHERVEDYADWYFKYSTTYKIMWEALKSYKAHALETSPISVNDAVALDVEKYIEKHFEKIVLKPEISDSELNSSFQKSLQVLHKNYLLEVARFDERFQHFLASETTHLEAIDNQNVRAEIDWKRQFNKVSMEGYEKGSDGAFVGVGLAAGGAIAGKAIASGAAKVFLAKLSIPFATKAVTVAGSAAAGAAAGSVAGPAGAIAGAGIGVLVDLAINEGVELANRDKFEADTHLVLDSLEKELESKEVEGLQKSVDIWFNDTINVLGKYSEE